MTSTGPYSESFLSRYKYEQKPIPRELYTKDSISYIIYNNPEFSQFREILDKSGYTSTLGSMQSSYTVFVPINCLPSDSIDKINNVSAINIIQSSTMNKRIPSELLENNSASMYLTLSNYNKLFVTNTCGKTQINKFINVIHKDIMACNGIIHVVDYIIWPENHNIV